MNEIALLLTSFACICYGIWQETKVEGWQMRVRWRNERIAELETTIAELEKRNAALAFALYGKQQMEVLSASEPSLPDTEVLRRTVDGIAQLGIKIDTNKGTQHV